MWAGLRSQGGCGEISGDQNKNIEKIQQFKDSVTIF
jgi:hypothetical protein